MNILLKVSGSISAYKVCSLASDLVKLGHSVKVALSRSALKFVGAAVWEGLTGNLVFTDDFAPGQRMDHIYLNDWADAVVLAPASAQTLNAISVGVGSGVLTTLFLARKKETPYLIFPAMNPRMWLSESVQKSVENLSLFENVNVFSPNSGTMACGHEGEGRLQEPKEILKELLKLDSKNKKKVLVTFGGTTENIDGVRQITNFSSGKTGIQICKELAKEFSVTALGSEQTLQGVEGLEGVEVGSFLSSPDLSDKMENFLSTRSYDIVIHAAAVSDFIPKNQSDKKISSLGNLTIEFIKTPKILNSLKSWSKNKNCKIISFKLTHNQLEEEVMLKLKSQFTDSRTDFIIHNELGEVTFNKHEYSIWVKDGEKPLFKGNTKNNMVSDIMNIGRF